MTKIVLSRERPRARRPSRISGPVDVIAEAHQLPPLPVPEPWDGLARDAGAHPLARPPRRRDRARRGTRRSTSRSGLLPQSDFHAHLRARARGRTAPGKPGLYRFFLAHTWSTTLLPDGQLPARGRGLGPARQQGRPRAAVRRREQRLSSDPAAQREHVVDEHLRLRVEAVLAHGAARPGTRRPTARRSSPSNSCSSWRISATPTWTLPAGVRGTVLPISTSWT